MHSYNWTTIYRKDYGLASPEWITTHCCVKYGKRFWGQFRLLYSDLVTSLTYHSLNKFNYVARLYPRAELEEETVVSVSARGCFRMRYFD